MASLAKLYFICAAFIFFYAKIFFTMYRADNTKIEEVVEVSGEIDQNCVTVEELKNINENTYDILQQLRVSLVWLTDRKLLSLKYSKWDSIPSVPSGRLTSLATAEAVLLKSACLNKSPQNGWAVIIMLSLNKLSSKPVLSVSQCPPLWTLQSKSLIKSGAAEAVIRGSWTSSSIKTQYTWIYRKISKPTQATRAGISGS